MWHKLPLPTCLQCNCPHKTLRLCSENIALHVHLSVRKCVHEFARQIWTCTQNINMRRNRPSRTHACICVSLFAVLTAWSHVCQEIRAVTIIPHTRTKTASWMALISLGLHSSGAAVEVTLCVWLWKWLSRLRRVSNVYVQVTKPCSIRRN